MFRHVGVLCAGVMVAAAGCTAKIGNTQVEATVKVDERAVEASLDATVEKVKRELEKRGLQVTVLPQEDSVRLVSATRSGDRFTLVLSRFRPMGGGPEQTRVRVEWSSKPDRELWLALAAALVTPVKQ